MSRVTATACPLDDFDGLVDLERSRAFHAGRRVVDLESMRALVAALPALPEPPLAIHVAGSEGKTSVTERLGAGLMAAGLSTATYTSPHLRDVRERMRIDGAFAADAELRDAVETVRGASAGLAVAPTWFESMTAAARVLFARRGVDAVVWETGLGGRLDATTVMPADICVITSISREHTAVLGDDIADIAAEKAGILRPGRPVVVSSSLPRAAHHVICERARALDCEVVMAPTGPVEDPDVHSSVLARSVLALLGDQGRLEFTAKVSAAVRRHAVVGRHEQHGELLFDGAHSVAACRLLARRLQGERFGALIFATTSGRDGAAMLEPLFELSDQVVLPKLEGPRASDPATLVAALGPTAARRGTDLVVAADVDQALQRAQQLAGGRRILVTGSLYLVGQLLPDRSPAC